MEAAISERQYEIIEAAGRLLTASGVSGLTIKNLAMEMEFSEGAIYRHFTSKEEIIIALLRFLAENMEERLSGTLAKAETAEEKFNALFRNQFSFFSKNPHFLVAVFSDGLMEASQRINETILEIMAVKMKHLLPVIKEGQQTGVFTRAINSEELLHIVIGAFRLQMFKWRASNFQFDIVRSGNKMIQSILKVIKTNEDGKK
jgi:AcrR family transcriptional regulator